MAVFTLALMPALFYSVILDLNINVHTQKYTVMTSDSDNLYTEEKRSEDVRGERHG